MSFARYRSHKVVEAAEILRVAQTSGYVVIGPGEKPEKVATPEGFFSRGAPNSGDFLVRYQPDGYLSWSPRAAFLEGYTAEPEDWRERLIRERDELAERLYKLRQFLMGPNAANLPAEQFELMKGQQYRMGQYCAILDARIKASAA